MKVKSFVSLMPLIATLVLSCVSKPASSAPEAVNTPAGVSITPEYFSPDGDGENDELFIAIKGGDISSWTFDILQPTIANREGQEVRVFKHFEGTGAQTIQWDGRSDPRERRQRQNAGATPADATAQPAMRSTRVMSSTDYPYVFIATDKQGVKGEPVNGIISVDVLVITESDGRKRVQVPSIVFRPGAADFIGLDGRIVANNQRVIRRIASILNKFPDYKVSVEGHANPENAPGTTARANEEKLESAKGSVSEKRAQVIVDQLVTDGVDKARLTAVGIGVSKPIADFDDTDNSWQNRRVEFYLQKQ
jgi:flagellar motor protein MotB